jgi:thioredoxin-dependent peroxiredoxin
MTNLPQIGTKAPDFQAIDQTGKEINLAQFLGQWLILYFYPKDNTPGCTTEAKEFSQYLPEFNALNAHIIGVSPDSEKSHCEFIDKHNLTIQLLSDPEHNIAENYGAWGLKKFMGKEYMGIIRSTFMINPQGEVVYYWRKVRVKNHAETVLKQLKEQVELT